MIHFRNIISIFQRWPILLVVAFVLCAIAMPTRALAEQPPAHSTAATASTACPQPKGIPVDPRFQNLRHIVLAIRVPYLEYLETNQCRKDWASCKRMAAHSSLFVRSPAFLRTLADPHHGYPEALFPENIAAILRPVIEKNWLPYVIPDAQCHPPSLTVLDADRVPVFSGYAAEQHERTVLAAPDTLVAVIEVNVYDQLGQHIAVITYDLSRSGSHPDMPRGHSLVAAISLPNTRDSVITALLKSYANDSGAFREPELEGIQYRQYTRSLR